MAENHRADSHCSNIPFAQVFPEKSLSTTPTITPTTGDGLLNHPGYQSTVTLVILSPSATCPILASPTTEPGRRGWKRRLGSPVSAPHFFARSRKRSFPALTQAFPRVPLCPLWFKLSLPPQPRSKAGRRHPPRNCPKPRRGNVGIYLRTENWELRTSPTHPNYSPTTPPSAPRIE
jgi:hypothetical protein